MPSRATTPPVVSRLRAQALQILDPVLPKDETFALLDFPHHPNVGDSAIWLGEIEYFRQQGRRPKYVATMHTIDWAALDHNIGDGPIFLHGGGNFGDLWPEFHDFRLEILRRYPRRAIIQLPQTIYFSTVQARDATAQVIKEQGNFTLFVRDEPSLHEARQHFECNSILCPDMAIHIGALPGIRSPNRGTLLHLRQDKESAIDISARPKFTGDTFAADWPDDPPKIERVVLPVTLLKLATSGRGFPPRGPIAREELYRQMATYRLARGINLLSSAERIVTDRLHGHILSLMLGKPQIVIDNSYGKLSNFISAWSTDETGSQVELRRADNFSDHE